MHTRLSLLIVLPLITGQDDKPKQEGTDKQISTALDKGIEYLIKQQKKNGLWGDDEVKKSTHKSDYPASLTSLACMSLLSTKKEDKKTTEAIKKGLEYVIECIQEDGQIYDKGYKPNESHPWGRATSLWFLSEIYKKDKNKDVEKKIKTFLDALLKKRSKDGGWSYMGGSSQSFLTAFTLISILKAKEAGFDVKKELLDDAAKLLKDHRKVGKGVAYTYSKTGKFSGLIGGAARTISVEVALNTAGITGDQDLAKVLELFTKNTKGLDAMIKEEKGCHNGKYEGVGSFYGFFGYFFAAHAAAKLGDKGQKTLEDIQKMFLKLQKEEGFWRDSIDHTGPSYGTALAIMVLNLKPAK